MSSSDYDVIVIGAGPGGYVAAIRAAQLGLRTAVVERTHLGGICLNWGCIPTKALLRSAEVLHLAKHAKSFGLKIENPSFDLEAVVKRSRGVASQLSNGVKFLMKKNKIDVIEGTARLEKGAPAPKGNAFARGGAGRQRSCQHGPKAKALPASADLIQDCSRRSRIGFGWPGEGALNPALLSALFLALAGRQQVHEIAGRLPIVSIF